MNVLKLTGKINWKKGQTGLKYNSLFWRLLQRLFRLFQTNPFTCWKIYKDFSFQNCKYMYKSNINSAYIVFSPFKNKIFPMKLEKIFEMKEKENSHSLKNLLIFKLSSPKTIYLYYYYNYYDYFILCFWCTFEMVYFIKAGNLLENKEFLLFFPLYHAYFPPLWRVSIFYLIERLVHYHYYFC